MAYIFHITETAAKKINELLNKDGSKLFKVMVMGGGCSGFQYDFNYKAEKEETDVVFSENGATVIVDDISLQYINNSTLDYEEDLGGAKFVIKNPNASAKCGCGNSFSV